MIKSASKVTINTGNVLNLIDIKKKAGQNVTEELSESIKLTLSEWKSENGFANQNGTAKEEAQSSHKNSEYMVIKSGSNASEAVLYITRPYDDSHLKMAEEQRKNFKIGVKIFINEDSTTGLKECLDNVFQALHTNYIDNVILAYNPETPLPDVNAKAKKASPIIVGSAIVKSNSDAVDNDNEADAKKCEAILPGIKILWEVLEDYVKNDRIYQLGVADVGDECLRKLHAWARVKPTIAQINLASCCVVPPSLNQFAKNNDVQLLTHADPPDVLSQAAVKTLSGAGLSCSDLDWCARYQVHIKCRGVLTVKGYVCKGTLRREKY